MMLRLLIVLFLMVAINASAFGQQWSRFRGKNGSGISDAKTIPTSWTDSDLNWKTALPGVGHSSPILWGKTIFLQSADPTQATRYVMAVDADSGKIQWQKEYPSSPYRFHRLNSYNSSTPAADANHVYACWSDNLHTVLKAFTHDGNEAWSRDLGPWVGQHGFAASPVVYRNMVILANSQQKNQLRPGQKPGQSIVYAFDAESGKQLWKSERVTTRVSYSVPCIYRNDKGEDELICCNTAEGIYSLNPETGKLNWAYDQAFDKRTVASPVIAEGLILGSCGSGGGGNFVVAVQPGSRPSLKYKVDRNANYVPTPVVFNGLVFLVSDKGIASCVNARSGEVLWRERLKGEYWASPICVNGRIYAINSAGHVTVFDATNRFEKVGEADLGEKCHSTPAVSGGRMFLRTVSHLMSVGGPS